MKIKKIAVLFIAALMVMSIALTGCGSGTNAPAAQDKAASGTEASVSDDGGAAAPGEVAGFEEFPIGDDLELGPLNVGAVYFQPVDMEPAGKSLAASQSDMHIEADIHAIKNELGYGVGDFVPYLTVKYEIASQDGKTKVEGTFMPMNASDGPHYGANIKLGPAGTYKVRFTIENPEAQGFLLHVDKATGVTGRYWTQPLVAEWDFNYVPRVW